MQDTDLFQLALGRLEPMRHVLPLSEIVGALTPPGPVKQRQKKRQPQKANATRSTGIVPARPPQGRAKQVHRRAEGSRRACRPLDCAPCRTAHSVLLRALKTPSIVAQTGCNGFPAVVPRRLPCHDENCASFMRRLHTTACCGVSLPSVPGAPRRLVSSSPVSLSSSIGLPPARAGCTRSSTTATGSSPARKEAE